VLEEPDTVSYTVNGEPAEGNYADTSTVEAVIAIHTVNGKDEYFAYRPQDKYIYSSNKDLENKIAAFIKQYPNTTPARGETMVHQELVGFVVTSTRETIYAERNAGTRKSHSRMYRWKGHYIISFWENFGKLKPVLQVYSQLFKDFNYPLEKIQFEPKEYWKTPKKLSAEEFFGKPVDMPEQPANALSASEAEQLHLNPELKKKVLKLPPHKLQKIADKIKMPLAQFKHYMGMNAAE
jgi:hypothetical protein